MSREAGRLAMPEPTLRRNGDGLVRVRLALVQLEIR
jgi:hypothetical protein